jgi:hypothetical protein
MQCIFIVCVWTSPGPVFQPTRLPSHWSSPLALVTEMRRTWSFITWKLRFTHRCTCHDSIYIFLQSLFSFVVFFPTDYLVACPWMIPTQPLWLSSHKYLRFERYRLRELHNILRVFRLLYASCGKNSARLWMKQKEELRTSGCDRTKVQRSNGGIKFHYFCYKFHSKAFVLWRILNYVNLFALWFETVVHNF